MQSLPDDLLEFNRVKLGMGIRISPGRCDLATAFADEIDLLRAAHGRDRILFEVRGDCEGSWDQARLRQLLANLIQNAVQYGAADRPVRVELAGAGDHVVLTVGNDGPHLSDEDRAVIFEPLRRGRARGVGHETPSLGLGLFVVREVARAHGGEAEVRSDEHETVFTVRLPRRTGN